MDESAHEVPIPHDAIAAEDVDETDLSAEVARNAYGLWLRGIDVDAISGRLGAPAGAVARAVASLAAVGEGATADTLRILERHLFAHLDAAKSMDKPKYVTALSDIASKLHQLVGRCGAREQGGSNGFCVNYPEPGRARCRLHGGASPRGPDHPRWRHGGRSKYAVPLTDDEVLRYDEYRANAYSAEHDLAVARVQRDRAVTAGLAGVIEGSLVDRLLRTHTAITRGMRVVHVADEASGRAMLAVILVCFTRAAREALGEEAARPLLALAAQYVAEIDWVATAEEATSSALPALPSASPSA